ncbi:hypothetical protein [Paraburkholderia aromaticivorans]|nr:hypothetical protein [Paraburkholderia aromaticivorans]
MDKTFTITNPRDDARGPYLSFTTQDGTQTIPDKRFRFELLAA